jgi:hypothetical protein
MALGNSKVKHEPQQASEKNATLAYLERASGLSEAKKSRVRKQDKGQVKDVPVVGEVSCKGLGCKDIEDDLESEENIDSVLNKDDSSVSCAVRRAHGVCCCHDSAICQD